MLIVNGLADKAKAPIFNVITNSSIINYRYILHRNKIPIFQFRFNGNIVFSTRITLYTAYLPPISLEVHRINMFDMLSEKEAKADSNLCALFLNKFMIHNSTH